MKRLSFLFILLFLLTSCSTLMPKKKIVSTLPVVSNLKAVGGIRSVRLTWSIVNDPRVKGYIIYRTTSKNGPFKKIATINDPFKSVYVDKGGLFSHLGDDMDYFYRVAVFSKNGIGPASPVVVGHTAPPPRSPTQIRARSGLPRMVTITWKPSADKSVVAYNIYRSLSPRGPFKKIGRVNGRLNTFFIDKGLKDGTTYYYSVTAINYAGVEGDILAYAKATTKPKPMAPRHLTARIAGAGKLLISWWPSLTPDVVKYRIYRGLDPKALSVVGEVSSAKLTYLDSGLKPGTTYYYQITAVDKDGIESRPSKIAAFKTKPLPKPPKGISAKQLEDGSVLISWDRGSPDTVEYKVYRRYYLIITKQIGTTKQTHFVDSTVKPNTTYYYWVRSVDQYGQESAPSPEVKIKTR